MKNWQNTKGGSPVKGCISDRKLNAVLGVPISTLATWKKTEEEDGNYRADLYWLLKSMTEEELVEYLGRGAALRMEERSEKNIV
jgi:hypothetical protein